MMTKEQAGAMTAKDWLSYWREHPGSGVGSLAVKAEVSHFHVEQRDAGIRLDERRKTLDSLAKVECSACANGHAIERLAASGVWVHIYDTLRTECVASWIHNSK